MPLSLDSLKPEEPKVIVTENLDGTTSTEVEPPIIDPTLAVNAALT